MPDGDAEDCAFHPEGADLPFDLRRQPLARRRPPPRQLPGGLRELSLELAQHLFLLRHQLLVTLEAIELRGGRRTEVEHRLLRIPVLPLESGERVQTFVDRLEPPGLDGDLRTERSERREHILQLRLGRVEPRHGDRERSVDPTELAEHARGPRQAARRRVPVAVENGRDLAQTSRQLLRVLHALPLGAELRLLARTEPRRVELADLEPQQVLALRPVALGGACAVDVVSGRPELRTQAPDPLAQVIGVGEAVEQLELTCRREQALMLVLTMDLDEVVSQPFEQPDRHRGVIGERPVAPGAAQLPTEDELPVVEPETGLVEQRRHGVAGLDLENRLHGGRLGIGPDDVPLGSGTTDEEDRIDEHRLARTCLAGQHVEPRRERDFDGLDDGEVADAQLPEHRARC